jgi:hypothetical protein
MFEVIVGLALLPAAIVVGVIVLDIGLTAIWILGGWLLAVIGILLMVDGFPGPAGFILLVLGVMWGCWAAKGAMQ